MLLGRKLNESDGICVFAQLKWEERGAPPGNSFFIPDSTVGLLQIFFADLQIPVRSALCRCLRAQFKLLATNAAFGLVVPEDGLNTR